MRRKLLQKLMLAACIAIVQIAGAANITVNQNITTNTTWTNNNTYILLSEILVQGATLTIEPGTIIKGQYNTLSRLVILPGAKIIAQGTPTQPIVFTSSQPVGQRKRGDWSGILVLGNAPINTKDNNGNPKQNTAECGTSPTYDYGGSNAADSSGVISYVRIEYAGYVCGTNVELNSLTLGGVGSKTKIDHVQVSFGQDDGFEFFGGTVNVSHIISYASRDDDFDTDFGWSGKAQFGLIVRVDTIADQGDVSNAFESDNDAGGTSNTPYTTGVISNFTIVGPAATKTSTIDAKYGWGARIRRNSSQSIFNSLFIGYKKGLFIDGDSSKANATAGGLAFRNNVIAGVTDRAHEASFDSLYILNPANAITVYGGNANDSVKLTAPYTDANGYNFLPQPGSPVLTGADFTNAKLTTGFATTAYRGAYGTENWSACWGEFTPNDEVYTSSPVNYGFTVNVSQSGNLPTATLTANASGANYSYNWSTGGSAANITVTNAGTYTVTVTSARGCTATATATVQGVGLNDISNISSISVFPNPTRDMATLEIALAESAVLNLLVTDITGKVMLNKTEQFSNGLNRTTINTNEYVNGIYLVSVKNGAENQTIRLVVSK